MSRSSARPTAALLRAAVAAGLPQATGRELDELARHLVAAEDKTMSLGKVRYRGEVCDILATRCLDGDWQYLVRCSDGRGVWVSTSLVKRAQ